VPDEYWRIVPRLRSNVVERIGDPPDGCRNLVVFALKGHGDFDPSLLSGLPKDVRVRRARLLPLVARVLCTKPPRVLELPEPMWYRYWPSTVLIAAAARFRRGSPPVVASVAMENFPARRGLTLRQLRLPPPVARVLDPLVRALWRRSLRFWDAFYFMSEAAAANYREIVPDVVARERVEQGLELVPACPTCELTPPEARPRVVLFAAQFLERKGIDVLLEAWTDVHSELGDWRLELAGFGPLASRVQEWARTRPEVAVTIAPSREALHEAFRNAAIVVLPSREVAWWREQIGYPILEGLSHGCAIVTTDDTGLSAWLREHGHEVVRAGDVSELAAALRRMCTRSERPAVLASLPVEDTRHVAERWFSSLAASHSA
jgi:glycosyltransferase involved in cell wall biosynthesis